MYALERRKKGMLTLVPALEGVLECPGPLVVQQGVDGRRTGAQENYWHKEKLCPSFLVRAVLTGVKRKKWWPAQSKHLKEVSIYNMYDRYDIEYDIECELQMRHRKTLTCTCCNNFSLRISGQTFKLSAKKCWPAQSTELKEVSTCDMTYTCNIECELRMRHQKTLTCAYDIIFSLQISGPSLQLRRLPWQKTPQKPWCSFCSILKPSTCVWDKQTAWRQLV